jgi:hypothetical protein
MKTKYVFVILISVVFLIATLAPPALAGSKSRHRWQGFAIGVGTAIIGQALLHHHYANTRQERFVYPHEGGPQVEGYRKDRHGHWEYRRVWVPPTYTKVWNPGHYDPRGHWVPGHWIEIKDSEGYWEKERIWVAGR